MLGRITAKINELWKPPDTTVERGKAALQQADAYQQNQQFEQALSSLNTAKAALKHGVLCGRGAESKPVLGKVYQKQAELWQRQKDFDVDVVRKRYAKALEYFTDPTQKAAVQEMLDLLPGVPASDAPQIKKRHTLSPSAVSPTNTIISTGIPAPFFVDPATPPASGSSHTSYALVEPDEITDTQHLAWCLQKTGRDGPQRALQTQLFELVLLIIQKFKKTDKTLACMQEAAALATVPQAESYGLLIEHTLEVLSPAHAILNVAAVQGLVVIVRDCPVQLLKKEGGVYAAVWTSMLQVLLDRLNMVHKDDPVPVLALLQGISQLLDAMVQAGVTGISRTELQQPLYKALRDEKTLNPKQDIALSWQIHYACEALAYIPNDESRVDSVLRCLFAVGKGAGSLAKAIKGVDSDSLLQSFGNLHEAFTAVREIASSAADCKELKEAIQNVLEAGDSFEGVGSDIQNRQRRTGWYVALQCMEPLIQANQLEKFEKLVRESAYRQDANFLQGVCQCLERLVCTQEDKVVQKKAIQFLQSLRDDTPHWMKEEGALNRVQQGAARQLEGAARHLNETLGTSFMFKQGVTRVKQHAEATLARLEASAAPLSVSDHTYVPPAWDPIWEKRPPTKLLKVALTELTIPLEQRLLKSLHKNIQQLQTTYLTSLQQDNEIRDALAHYVPPEGVLMTAPNYEAENRFNLNEKVHDFLEQDTKKVLLLLGEAGLGKSTFNRHLTSSLWEAYIASPDNTPIPLFIALSTPGLGSPSHNRVTAFFESQGFSKEQIETLRTTRRLVFIMDGFDEIERHERAFYKDNQLDNWQKAKVIITSRPEYLGSSYKYKFHPPEKPEALQEYRLAPFSEPLIWQYVDKYKAAHPESRWTAEKYKEMLKRPDLSELVGNPFLLKMALSVLSEPGEWQLTDGQPFMRIALYERFVQNWFDRSQQRLAQIQLTKNQRETFQELDHSGFAEHGVGFCKRFAIAMYRAGEVVVTYVAAEHAPWEEADAASQQSDWRKRFLGDGHAMTVLMRLNAPLIRQGDQYRFIHKSIRDYFVARALWEPKQELQRVEKTALLNTLYLVKDPAVLDFLAERVRQEPIFKSQLLDYIEQSKREDVQIAAANAITILVRAGVQFNGMDLNGIRIPGADLSFGVFDSAQLQGADLSNTNLRASWLRQANLSGAKMGGVQFGEWPFPQEDSSVNVCTYSRDGKTCAVGLKNGTISVYGASNWEKIYTLVGHTDEVLSVVYSPSGAQIASGSGDKTVRLWDARTGKLSYILSGHTGEVLSVVYSRNGKQIALGIDDKTVRLWDAQTGKLHHTLYGYTSSVTSVVYSPTDEQIAYGSGGNTVQLWDAHTGKLRHTLVGHTDEVLSVVYSPNGRQIASGSKDATVRLWDAHTGEFRYPLQGHTDKVWSVVYSPTGEQIASGSGDKTVRLWDAHTGQLRHTLKQDTGSVKSMVYSPNGKQIALGSDDKTVRLWDAQTGQLRHTLYGHTGSVTSVVYSPSDAQIAYGSWDKTVRLWDAGTGQLRHTLDGHTDKVRSVMYSPSDAQIASGSGDHMVRLWDAHTGQLLHTLDGHTDKVWSVVYSPSGVQIASGSDDHTVRLWDAHTGQLLHTLDGHTDEVLSVVYSPSGAEIASGSRDKMVRLWDADTGKPGLILNKHTDAVLSVVYSPTGEQIASGSGDKTVRLWDAQTGQLIHTLKGHADKVWSVVYSPNGAQIASSSDDHTVRLWDAQSGDPGPILNQHTDEVWSVVYSPSGAQIASGGKDATVLLWDAQTGQLRHTLQGHTGSVDRVVYSPNGRQIASGSKDATVRLWDVVSGQCLAVIQGFNGAVTSIAWKVTNDGTYLVTGCTDKSVRLWHVIEEQDHYQVRLHWSSTHEVLAVSGTSIQGVQGLSSVNVQLLKQRGAVGDVAPNK